MGYMKVGWMSNQLCLIADLLKSSFSGKTFLKVIILFLLLLGICGLD